MLIEPILLVLPKVFLHMTLAVPPGATTGLNKHGGQKNLQMIYRGDKN